MTPDRFRHIRNRASLTQGQLATRLRLSRRAIQSYEGGERKISGPVALLMEHIEKGN